MPGLLWRAGWRQAPDEEYRAAEDEILVQPAWIFDGLGAWPSLLRRVAAADAILFTDYPLETALAWARRRVEEHRNRPRAELAEGCPEGAIEERLYPLIEHIHREWRPKLVTLLGEAAQTKPVHVLATPADTARLVAAVERLHALPPPIIA